MTSLSSSSRLPARIAATLVMPVVLPPGRARLSASPVAIGSVTPMKTIGTVEVVFFAATRGVRRDRDQQVDVQANSSAGMLGQPLQVGALVAVLDLDLCPST